jgi:hypothetical protein
MERETEGRGKDEERTRTSGEGRTCPQRGHGLAEREQRGKDTVFLIRSPNNKLSRVPSVWWHELALAVAYFPLTPQFLPPTLVYYCGFPSRSLFTNFLNALMVLVELVEMFRTLIESLIV